MNVDEFLMYYPEAEPHCPGITQALAYLHQRKVGVIMRGDLMQHKVVWSGATAEVFLSKKLETDAAVFGLFHEYGHVKDGPPPTGVTCSQQLERERRAWAQGAGLVGLHGAQYTAEMTRCLEAYEELAEAHPNDEFAAKVRELGLTAC